ncbi:MAG: hypothetical protein AB8U82_00395 [Rickettsia endosymbiont of Haemaphysalis japonica]
METRSKLSTSQDANKDGNTAAYYLDSINKFPLNVFAQIIEQYSVDNKQIKLDKLQGCVNIPVKPRDIQYYPTPKKSGSNKDYFDGAGYRI